MIFLSSIVMVCSVISNRSLVYVLDFLGEVLGEGRSRSLELLIIVSVFIFSAVAIVDLDLFSV